MDKRVLKEKFEAESKRVVQIASALDTEASIIYLIGHLRELRLLSRFDEQGLDHYAGREEALCHAIPILLNFGRKRIELSTVNEILNLLDAIERLMSVSEMLNTLELVSGSNFEEGVEVRFEGKEDPDFEDLQNYRNRLIQFHSFQSKPLDFPGEWTEVFERKLKYFDVLLKSSLDFGLDEFVEFLSTAAREQERRLNIGGDLFQSHEISTLDGYSFSWDYSTFSWTEQEIRRVFMPNGDKYIEKIFKTFEFIPSNHESPFVLYEQLQFNPFMRIGERWFFSLEYLLGSSIPMITRKLYNWSKEGMIPEEAFKKASERILDDEIVDVLERFGFKKLFRGRKFKGGKNDDYPGVKEIDLFFQTPCGDYLVVESKGGGLTDEMLYGLSLKGLQKERTRTYAKIEQLKEHDKLVQSDFAMKKLEEYVDDFDRERKIELVCVSRYPFFTNRGIDHLFCSVEELEILLSKGIDRFADKIPHEELIIGRKRSTEIPRELQDMFSETEFTISLDAEELESARKFVGYALWLNDSEGLYTQEVEGKRALMLFRSKRQAAFFAKHNLREVFRLMNINIDMLSRFEKQGYMPYLIISVEGARFSGGFTKATSG